MDRDWIIELETKYKERRETLIPRLLNWHATHSPGGAMTGLAAEAGVHKSTVSRYCEKAGIPNRVVYGKEAVYGKEEVGS